MKTKLNKASDGASQKHEIACFKKVIDMLISLCFQIDPQRRRKATINKAIANTITIDL